MLSIVVLRPAPLTEANLCYVSHCDNRIHMANTQAEVNVLRISKKAPNDEKAIVCLSP